MVGACQLREGSQRLDVDALDHSAAEGAARVHRHDMALVFAEDSHGDVELKGRPHGVEYEVEEVRRAEGALGTFVLTPEASLVEDHEADYTRELPTGE